MRNRKNLKQLKAKIILCSIIVVSLVFSVSGCLFKKAPEPGPQDPSAEESIGESNTPSTVTVTDDLGRRVDIRSNPSRIVSLAPSNTEILYALSLGDKVVGVTSFCNYPPQVESVEKVGELTPNIEKIIALAPNLVIGIQSLEDAAEKLTEAGIPVLLLDPKNFDDVLKDIKLVAKATGSETEGEALCQRMSSEVKAIKEEVSRSASGARPRVFVVLDVEGLWTAGPGTFIDELITLAGGENLAKDAKEQYIQYSEEALIAQDPDVIILTGPGERDLYGKSSLAGLKAIKEKRVYEVSPDLVSRPGPRLVEGLREIQRAIKSEG